MADLPRAPHFAAYADIDSMCIDGRLVHTVKDYRSPVVFTPCHWRITGQDEATKALRGEWQSGHIESEEEQIERLTRERDAALARAVAAETKVAKVLDANIPDWLRGDL